MKDLTEVKVTEMTIEEGDKMKSTYLVTLEISANNENAAKLHAEHMLCHFEGEGNYWANDGFATMSDDEKDWGYDPIKSEVVVVAISALKK